MKKYSLFRLLFFLGDPIDQNGVLCDLCVFAYSLSSSLGYAEHGRWVSSNQDSLSVLMASKIPFLCSWFFFSCLYLKQIFRLSSHQNLHRRGVWHFQFYFYQSCSWINHISYRSIIYDYITFFLSLSDAILPISGLSVMGLAGEWRFLVGMSTSLPAWLTFCAARGTLSPLCSLWDDGMLLSGRERHWALNSDTSEV